MSAAAAAATGDVSFSKELASALPAGLEKLHLMLECCPQTWSEAQSLWGPLSTGHPNPTCSASSWRFQMYVDQVCGHAAVL